MANIPLGSVGNIIRIGVKIKEAVKNVKQNEKECRDIERCVARVARIIDCFGQTLKSYDEVGQATMATVHKDNNMSMHDALEDLAESLEGALNLVTKCQRKHVFRRFVGAGDMAKELRQVQDDILRKLTLGSFASSVVQLGITLMTFAQPAPPQNRSEKDETNLATGSGASSNPLSELIHFNLPELELATHNFSEENLIGSGAFAKVFKGVLRNGLVVAIKDFKQFYGNDRVLRNEIEIGGKLEHSNVVKTLGYCIDDKVVPAGIAGQEREATESRRILVIGYLPNGSLGNITSGAQRIYWPFCFRIIQGIAQGLRYLHEQNILHLDLKPENIIFDSDMNPVITDFGVSMVLDNELGVVITQSVGTLGFVAPEHIERGVVSKDCDVFAFGIILLRTIFQACAKLGFKDYYYYRLDADSKREWAALLQDMHKMKELFDPTLVKDCEVTEVARCIKVGLLCREFDPVDRPTIADAIDMLNGGRIRLASRINI